MTVEYAMNSKEFYSALNCGDLIGSHCKDCGTNALPQRYICPTCHSENCEIMSYSGKGELVAYTVIFVPPVMMAKAGYDAKNPYCVGIVELEEGPRISAQILDVDLDHPENIMIGTELLMSTVTRGENENQETFLAFKPA